MTGVQTCALPISGNILRSGAHPEVGRLAQHNVAEPPTMKTIKDLLISKSNNMDIVNYRDAKRLLAEQGIKWKPSKAEATLSAEGTTFNLHKDRSGKIIGIEVFGAKEGRTQQLYTALVDQQAKELGNLYRPKGGGRFGGYVDAKQLKDIVQLDNKMFSQSQLEKQLATKAKIENVALKVGEGIQHSDGTITPVTNQTGVKRTSGTNVVGGSVQDTRLTQIKETDKILTTQQMQAAERQGYAKSQMKFFGRITGEGQTQYPSYMTPTQIARAERKALEQMYRQDQIAKVRENAAAKELTTADLRAKQQAAEERKTQKLLYEKEQTALMEKEAARNQRLAYRAEVARKMGRVTEIGRAHV